MKIDTEGLSQEQIFEKMREQQKNAAPQETQETQTETQETETSEETTEQEKNTQTQKLELNDDIVRKYLSEKRGAEIDSLDLLLNPEKEEFKYSSEEAAKFDAYVRETGRGLNDYLSLQEDIDAKSDLEIVRAEYLRQGNDLEDFEFEYNLDLKPLSEEDREEMSDRQIAKHERDLKKRDLDIKKEAREARKKFKELQEKLKTPMDNFNREKSLAEEGAKLFKENVTQAINSLGDSLGIEGYKSTLDTKELAERYSSPQSIINQFKDANGNLNYQELVKTLEIGKNFETIIKLNAQQASNKATEDIIEKMHNPSSRDPKPNPQSKKTETQIKNDEAAKSFFEEQLRLNG